MAINIPCPCHAVTPTNWNPWLFVPGCLESRLGERAMIDETGGTKCPPEHHDFWNCRRRHPGCLPVSPTAFAQTSPAAATLLAWSDMGELKRVLMDDLLRERNTFAKRAMKDVREREVELRAVP